MRKAALLCVLAALVLILAPATPQAQTACVKIKDGGLVGGNGAPIVLGYDQWGYNYQAHVFNGLYDNYSRPATPATSGSVNLIMKWSDEWIANVDCNFDNRLDRGLDMKAPIVPAQNPSGVSRGWLTNHMEGDCTNPTTGELEHYTYFSKIVWVGPAPAAPSADPWAAQRIWGQYAIIEEVSNNAPPSGDPGVCGGTTGGDRSKLVHPAGLGFYTNGTN